MFVKRKYPRFPVTGSAIIKASSNRVKFPGSIEMFSRNGIGIYTNVVIEKETPIQLEIDIYTGSYSSKCHLNGRVKSISDWGGKNLLGVLFDREISRDNEPHLFSYLGCLEKELIIDYGKTPKRVP